MALKPCIKATANLSEEDVDAVLGGFESYQGSMPQDKAAKAAIDDAIADVKQEQTEFFELIYDTHPDLIKPRTSASSDPVDQSLMVSRISTVGTLEEKAKELGKLGRENEKLIKPILQKIDRTFKTRSGISHKEQENIISKASRPSILFKKPWHSVEHIRDGFRFKTVVDNYSQLPEIIKMLEAEGIEIIKADTEKMLDPGDWGWRITAFDLLMPNGQIVEWYLPITELEVAKKAQGHELFEKWRNHRIDKLSREDIENYRDDLITSYELYGEAFDDFLIRTNQTEEDIRPALESAAALGVSNTRLNELFGPKTSPISKGASAQTPSGPRTLADPGAITSTDPSSLSSNTIVDIPITSAPSVPQTVIRDGERIDSTDPSAVVQPGDFTSNSTPIDVKPKHGLQKSQVDRAILELQEKNPGLRGMTIHVYQTMEEAWGPGAEEKMGIIEGGFMTGSNEVVIIAGNISGTDQLMTVLRHEIIGHYGLRQVLGKGFDRLLGRVYAARTGELRGAYEWVAKNYPDLVEANDVGGIADEMLARSAETRTEHPTSLMAQIYDGIIKLLNQMGLMVGKTSIAEVQSLIRASEKNIRRKSKRRDADPTSNDFFAKVGGGQSVSTRLPSAVKKTEDPLGTVLTVDYRVALNDKVSLKKNIKAVSEYPNTKKTKGSLEDEAEAFISHAENNLLWLHDHMPENWRSRAKLWYEGGRRTVEAWGDRYGISEMQGAAAIAVLSPQNGWFANVSQAERIADAVFGLREVKWSRKMTATANLIGMDETMKKAKGKTFGELLSQPDVAARWMRVYDQTHNDRSYSIVTPEGGVSGKVTIASGANGVMPWKSYSTIAKAISILMDGRAENVYHQLGREHKVRNFYNNLYAPESEHGFVTIDTHAVAAALLRPLSAASTEVAHAFGGTGSSKSAVTGLNGTYVLYLEAYRRAAAKRGILPREMQSITWEAVRGLFEAAKKSGLKKGANAIWEGYKSGDIDQAQAQKDILAHAGDIAAPAWTSSEYDETPGPTYEGPGQAGVVKNTREGSESNIMFEVAPDPNDVELTAEWDSLDHVDKLAISERVASKIVPKILGEIGSSGEFSMQLGGYEGATNPSMVLKIDRGQNMITAAKLLGHALGQDSMMVISEIPVAGTDRVESIDITIPEGWGATEIEGLYDQLWSIEKDGEKLVAGHSTLGNTMSILNFTDVTSEELGGMINDKLDGQYEIEINEVHSAFIDNTEYGYDSETSTSGNTPTRGASIQRRPDNFRSEATELLKKELASKKETDAPDPGLRFRRAATDAENAPTGGSLGLPEENLKKKFVRLAQDGFNRVKELQNAIVEQGGSINFESDVYGAEERSSGKVTVRLNQLDKDHMQPLMDFMREQDITIEALDEYLIAKHAQERNAWIASVNDDMPDGGSGMSNQAAQDILDSYPDRSQMDRAALFVYTVNNQNLSDLVEGGHMTQEQVDALQARWNYYVPLKGKEGEESQPGGGSGYSISASIKRAMGRGEGNTAESPTAHSFGQAESTIVRTEKTKIGAALLNLVRENPDPNFWTISERQYENFVDAFGEPFEGYSTAPDGMIENLDYTRSFDHKGKVVFRLNPNYKNRDDVFTVMHEGKELLIQIKDKVVMEQLKKMNSTQLNAVVAGFGTVNRYLAMINTALNPEFVITNFERDFQTAMVNLGGEHSADIAARVALAIPGAVRGIWQSTFDTSGTSEWRDMYDEMQKEGGSIGFFGLEDVDAKVKKIQARLSNNHGVLGRSKAGIAAVRDAVLDANISVENAARLAAYKIIKEESIANGLDPKEAKAKAASVAKNLTVNFNRKGELAPVLNSAYLFYNASIQGSARIITALENPRVRKIAGAIAATAFALAMYNRAAGGDDDDEIPYWDKISDHVKQTNIIIMHPDGSGEYSKIRLPYGYNVFFYGGSAMHDMMFNPRKSVAEQSLNMLSATMNAFNPIQGADFVDTIMPTVLKPTVQDIRNLNFMATPIKPENPFDTYDRPESRKVFKSTNPALADMMAALSDATGGDDTHAGYIDISPETVKHYVNWLTGGAGMTAARTLGTAINLATGEELEAKNVPFARTLVGKPSAYFDTERFYSSIKKVAAVEAQLKIYKGTDEWADYRFENSEVHKLAIHVRRYKNRIKNLRSDRDKAYADDNDDLANEKREEIRQQMMEFSMKYEAAIDAQG